VLADLHRHLDGSLRPATVAALAAELGVAVPERLCFSAGMGLAEALSRFAFTLSLLTRPEAVARVAAEICQDAAAEGVTTLEIRFAPQLHVGGSMGEIIDAALEGIAGRAGLILCGLYGEPPALLSELVRLGADRPGVVGLDLAGGPSPGHDFSMRSYAPASLRRLRRAWGARCTPERAARQRRSGSPSSSSMRSASGTAPPSSMIPRWSPCCGIAA
jgi:adenosine deaminase